MMLLRVRLGGIANQPERLVYVATLTFDGTPPTVKAFDELGSQVHLNAIDIRIIEPVEVRAN